MRSFKKQLTFLSISYYSIQCRISLSLTNILNSYCNKILPTENKSFHSSKKSRINNPSRKIQGQANNSAQPKM